MKYFLRLLIIFVFQLNLNISLLFAQTTGKIAGNVVDKETKEPLPGVNVFIAGTSFGSATNMNGEFNIINVPPGNYNVNVQMIGYAGFMVENLRVSVNRTSYIKAELTSTVLEGETPSKLPLVINFFNIG